MLLGVAGGYGVVSQWLFLMDDSVSFPEGWAQASQSLPLLAVQLQAHPEAMDFLSPAADIGSVASLR